MFGLSLSNLPITRKLTMIMLLSAVAAVLIASSIFGVTEALNYQRNTVDEISTLGDVIGTNSTAAITFEDEVLAGQMLTSLGADNRIVNAHIFLADGDQLAAFNADGHSQLVDTKAQEYLQSLIDDAIDAGQPVEEFDDLRFLDTVRPIYFDDELIGFLHLRASLEKLVATLYRIGMMAIGTVLFSMLIAYFLSFRLQAVVSRPIVRLSKLMQRVSSEKDYTLRAEPSGGDEIGSLMTGFNNMLEQIGVRDLQLAEANSQLKQAVRETMEAKIAAEKASGAKSDFLARMSHEIRTPMNGVLGMTELLLTSELKDTERRFAQTIQQSGESLLEIINDILDYSKIEAGKLTLDESDFDVVEVVEGIVDLLYKRAQDQGVELIAAVNPDIDTFARGDSSRIRQVLMNLVGNAIKFTQEGEVVVSLSRRDGVGGDPEYFFSVRDTGIGIEPRKCDMIFESFAQADVSTTRQYGGTGLGLAISKQLVELMRGEVGVDSTPGEGSTFWFSLPLTNVSTEALNSTDNMQSLSGFRVLLVDASPTSRELLQQQLTTWGIEVRSVPDTASAIAVLEEEAQREANFDLLILDVDASEIDGCGFATDIRARTEFASPTILMLTSVTVASQADHLSNAGIDHCLSKPVRRAQLRGSVERALKGEDSDTQKMEHVGSGQVDAEPAFDLKVLVVEDIPINMQVSRQMLFRLGCDVVEAENGELALQAIYEHKPDIVLMDCQMPVMDGYMATRKQRTREAKRRAARIPIIALTANAHAEDKRKCLDAGMDDFISKPFTRQILSEALSRWSDPTRRTQAVPAIKRTPEKQQSSDAQLDVGALQQIADLDPDGNGEFLNSVIDTYTDNSEDLMRELATAVVERNQDGIVRAAHALKSSSANVGATRVAGLCSAMEKGARNGDLSSVEEEHAHVETEYDAAIKLLIENKREVAA